MGEEGTIVRRAEEASSAQEAFYLLVQRRHGWVFCGWAYVYIIEGVGGGYGEVWRQDVGRSIFTTDDLQRRIIRWEGLCVTAV